jgi:hypothetical protein
VTPDLVRLGLVGDGVPRASDELDQGRSQTGRPDAGLVHGPDEFVERVPFRAAAKPHEDADGEVDHAP